MATMRATFTCGRGVAQRRPCPRAVAAGAVVAEPASVPVRSADGSEAGNASLSLKVAEPSTARHVVHRYMLTAQASTRQGSANTKTRSEVRGGGRKPYQQKGTGRARQGSTRTPLRPGGGVTFGPKPKDWSIDMNKKEKKVAMATALQSAACDMVVLESLPSMEDRKTKSMVGLCKNMGADVMSEKVLLVLTEENKDAYMAGRNIAKLTMNTADCLRVTDVLGADKIIVEKAALDAISTKFA